MIDLIKIDSKLDQMCFLLKSAHCKEWVGLLSRIRSNFQNDPKAAANEILRLYGGMGSLNDLVLYDKGQPMVQENRDLDSLRSELYELCRKI